MLIDSGVQNPFAIVNTDGSVENDTHLWRFLNLHPQKQIFLFNSFGFETFKDVILQDDQRVLNKIFYDIKQFDKKDNKMTLVTLNLVTLVFYERI